MEQRYETGFLCNACGLEAGYRWPSGQYEVKDCHLSGGPRKPINSILRTGDYSLDYMDQSIAVGSVVALEKGGQHTFWCRFPEPIADVQSYGQPSGSTRLLKAVHSELPKRHFYGWALSDTVVTGCAVCGEPIRFERQC